jgi:hypothetical protein
VGAQVAGWIFDRMVTDADPASLPVWGTFWWIPAAFAAAVMVFFAIFFRGGPSTADRPVRVPPLTPEPGA